MVNFYKFVEILSENKPVENPQTDTQSIVQKFLASPEGQKSAALDCKSVTRAFVNWAEAQKIPVRVILIAPSAETVAQRPELKGKSGTGDMHIMPIVNNDAIDFTARQFPGVSNQFNNPLITPVSKIRDVYQKIGGLSCLRETWKNPEKIRRYLPYISA